MVLKRKWLFFLLLSLSIFLTDKAFASVECKFFGGSDLQCFFEAEDAKGKRKTVAGSVLIKTDSRTTSFDNADIDASLPVIILDDLVGPKPQILLGKTQDLLNQLQQIDVQAFLDAARAVIDGIRLLGITDPLVIAQQIVLDLARDKLIELAREALKPVNQLLNDAIDFVDDVQDIVYQTQDITDSLRDFSENPSVEIEAEISTGN